MKRRDPGVLLVTTKLGGLAALASAINVTKQSVDGWIQVPQARLFQVCRVAQVDPLLVRPDLAAWILEERRLQRQAAVREHFSVSRAAFSARPAREMRRVADQVNVDTLVSLAAARFIAAERKLKFNLVLAGDARDAGAARALAMALAHITGRASSTNVGAVFGTTRQNVDNASERFLRARDGDDPDDVETVGDDGVARVSERGRLRRFKEGADELAALEARFAAVLAGDDHPNERRTA